MTFETFSHTYLHIPLWWCFSALRIMPHARKPSTQQDNGYSIINNTYVLLQWAISLFVESGLRSRLSHLHELVLILQFTSNHLVVFHKIINEYNCIYRIVLKNQFVWVCADKLQERNRSLFDKTSFSSTPVLQYQTTFYKQHSVCHTSADTTYNSKQRQTHTLDPPASASLWVSRWLLPVHQL